MTNTTFFVKACWKKREIYFIIDHKMNSQRKIIILFLTLFIISFGCDSNGLMQDEYPSPKTNILPQETNTFPLFQNGEQQTEETNNSTQVINSPRVQLPSNSISHQTVDLNLDEDEFDEQIVVYKLREDPDDRIYLMVIDYDAVRSTNFISWQGSTLATNLRTFTVYGDDLTGNQLPEILAFGLNQIGEQTLDVFSLNPANSGYGLQYANILSIQSDVSIEISEQESISGAKRIIANNRDLNSDNLLDLIQSQYIWGFQENRYILSKTSPISGSNIAEAQLSELYNSNEQTFTNFIRGAWYRVKNSQTDTNVFDSNLLRIIYFDPELNNISFYRDSRMVSFNWLSSTKSVYGGRLRVDIRNEVIPAIKSIGWITVEGIDILSLSLSGTDKWTSLPKEWTGYYRRLTNDQKTQLISSNVDQVILDPISLSGLYRSPDGSELFFSSPVITFRDTNSIQSTGGYVIYTYQGQNILQILNLTQTGTVKGYQSYLLAYEETDTEQELVRRLSLEPVSIQSSGLTPDSGLDRQYEQRIQKTP